MKLSEIFWAYNCEHKIDSLLVTMSSCESTKNSWQKRQLPQSLMVQKLDLILSDYPVGRVCWPGYMESKDLWSIWASKELCFHGSCRSHCRKKRHQLIFTDWFSHEGFYHEGVSPIPLKLFRTRDPGPRYSLFWCHFFCETSTCLAILRSEADICICI